jgi:hypothetical protein
MFTLQLLDVIIGTVFVYLVLSLLCSGINELIAKLLTSRSRHLEGWLERFFNDTDLLQQFHNQPLIKELTNHPITGALSRIPFMELLVGSGKTPAYIPSRTFTLALLNVIASADLTTATRTLDDVRKKLNSPPDAGATKTLHNARDTTKTVNDIPVVSQTIRTLIADAENLAKAQQNIEKWFDDAMERVSGRYKRRTQWVILALAMLLSWGLNVDTFRVFGSLYYNSTLRAAVVSAAQRATAQPYATAREQVLLEYKDLNLPLGRVDGKLFPDNGEPWGWSLIGWLITGFAVSQGAPFWFDVLNKLVNMRATGEPPPTTSK